MTENTEKIGINPSEKLVSIGPVMIPEKDAKKPNGANYAAMMQAFQNSMSSGTEFKAGSSMHPEFKPGFGCLPNDKDWQCAYFSK